MNNKKRLDLMLIKKGFFNSRSKAQAAVICGEVSVNGQIVNKCSHLVEDEDRIDIIDKKPKYVGRGGEKLEGAIKKFNLNVKGKIAMDIGASTGGFTECLIKNGARLVFAVDVGHSQLSESLKNSTKIINLEKVNARYLTKKRMKNILEEKGYSKEIIDFSENINFAVIDVSFISILKIIPALLNLILPESQIVALIKPQFEAGKGIAEKGVIKDKKVIDKIIQRIRKDIESMGLKIKGITPSPVLGAKGNQEYLVYMVR